MDNTKNKDGRPKDGRPKDVIPKRKSNQMSEKQLPKTAHWQPLISLQTTVEEPIII